MHIRPKPPEQIQAQVADFAEHVLSQGPHQGAPQRHVYAHIVELARGSVADAVYNYDHETRDYYNNTRTIDTRAHTIPAATYLAHLRHQRRQSAIEGDVESRTTYLQAYNQFPAEIRGRIAGIAADPKSHLNSPDRLGSGTSAAGYAFEYDGCSYIAKIAHAADRKAWSVDWRMRNLAVGKGLPRLEQMAAASYEDGVVIVERMPGVDLAHAPITVADQVTVEQLTEAIVAMDAAHQAGVKFDASSAGNYMYDTRAGFGFIDYMPQGAGSNDHSYQETFTDKLRGFASNLAKIGVYQTGALTREELVLEAEQSAPRMRLLQKYRMACMAQPDAERYREALDYIDSRITTMRETIQNVATPGWLDQYVLDQAKRAESARRAEERIQRNLEAGIPDLV